MGCERGADVIGLLCPGQGSHFVGMGKDLADTFPIARETFEEADAALDFPLSRLCWEGPDTELTLTVNAQPAILTHSIAVWRILASERPVRPAIGAGHSLGEFSAHVAAGSFSFMDAVRLVRRRGQLMYEAGQQRPGSMAAVLGLDDVAIEEVCKRASNETGGVAVPANFNSPGQVVISGDVESMEVAATLARETGARRALPLNVSGAFHSPLMQGAAEGLREALDGVSIGDPAFPVVSNVSAQPVESGSVAREFLLRQLTAPVRWVDTVRAMIAHGASEFLEVGPGNVLTGLLRRIDRGAGATPLGTAEELRAYITGE